MTIKTFRGSLADLEQETIHLRTKDGKTGYRIVKFAIMANTPGVAFQASVIKIFTEQQATVDALVNFSDDSLLGASYLETHGAIQDANYRTDTVFEGTRIFNQDIFVTHKDVQTGAACNYYIELEQVKLNDNESTMSTLQSIRSRYESYTPAGPT